jgi:hypothetical protein
MLRAVLRRAIRDGTQLGVTDCFYINWYHCERCDAGILP